MRTTMTATVYLCTHISIMITRAIWDPCACDQSYDDDATTAIPVCMSQRCCCDNRCFAQLLLSASDPVWW